MGTWLYALAPLALAAGCRSVPGAVDATLARDLTTQTLVVTDAGAHGGEGELRRGDELLSVEGHDVRDLDDRAVRRLLRGPAGTSVGVTVVRGGRAIRLAVPRRPAGSGGSDDP